MKKIQDEKKTNLGYQIEMLKQLMRGWYVRA
jgi:hypothetical protein